MINFNPNFRFMKTGNYMFPGSTSIMLISAFLILFKGLNLGIDFTQGTRFDISISNSNKTEIRVGEIKDIMNSLNLDGNYSIKELTSDRTIKNNQISSNTNQIFSIISQLQFDEDEIISKINQIDGYQCNRDMSVYQTIGPKMGSELAESAILSLGIAVILILIYITFRFNSLFALSSILALIHDILITAGIFSLFNFEISLPIIAAFLMILGYSLNDTIVVFDRIRENLNLTKKGTEISDIVNHSINQTLSRTILTSLTTLIVLTILYFVGSYLIKLFTLALIIGVMIGTYSSIFIASFSFKILYNRYGHLLNRFDLEEDEN